MSVSTHLGSSSKQVSEASLPAREWLTLPEAAAWLGLSPKTILRAKDDHTNPLFPKKTAVRGGKHLYRVADLRAWVEALPDA